MNFDDIKAAQTRIKGHVKRTPLEHSKTLSEHLGTNVFVKYELFQKTGAFKPRGAFNKLLQFNDEERAKGVVAVSGGNHAQAVAFVSRELDIDAVIAMPENTPQNYLDATRGYGATIDLKPTIAEAFKHAEELRDGGRVFVHPFDDPTIVAGQGTVGLEIVEDLPNVTDVFVSIGGGGLAGGVATAIKAHDANVRIWGVETDGADAMAKAIAAGEPVTLPAITSIAKTLGAPYVTELTLDLVRELLESVTVVSDAEAVDALYFIAERLKVITEPAASCTLAAARRRVGQFGPNDRVVLIFCGGNTSIYDISGYGSLLK